MDSEATDVIEVGDSSNQNQQPDAPDEFVMNSTSLDISPIFTDVRVIKADRVGEGLNSYIVFQVSVKLGNFASEVVLSRRYKEFKWLHDNLCEHFKGVIIPTLPESTSVLSNVIANLGLLEDPSRYTPIMLEKQRRSMDKYLKRIVSHPILAKSTHLATFLNPAIANVEPPEKSSEVPIRRLFSTAAKETEYAARTLIKGNIPFSRDLERLRDEQYSGEVELRRQDNVQMEIILSRLSKSVERWVRARYEMAASAMEVSAGFKALASLDPSMSEATRAMAQSLENIAKVTNDQLQQEEVSMLDPLVDAAEDCTAAKAIFRNRDDALHNYEVASAQLEAVVNERAKAAIASEAGASSSAPLGLRSILEKISIVLDPDSQAKARDMSVASAQDAVDREKKAWEELSQQVLEESSRLQRHRSETMTNVVRDSAHLNVESVQKSLVAWQALLVALDNNPPATAQGGPNL